MNLYNIEEKINSALQKTLSFKINDKTVKRGKLILFSVKEFYLNFKLLDTSCNAYKTYEIPYPFSFSFVNNNYYFDYRLKTLLKDNSELQQHCNLLKKIKFSKLYDNVLIASVNDIL